VTLGDRFLFWKTGWSGKHSNMKPNEALYWYLIKWAKAKGYRYFDFGSVNRKTALLVKQKVSLPKEIIKTPSFFKTGFGGEIIHLSEALVYIPNIILNSLYRIACMIKNLRQ
jgi:lipid II:glycine glycyltransferase (peptidoglycan interpeptide bridge formation enzyme)